MTGKTSATNTSTAGGAAGTALAGASDAMTQVAAQAAFDKQLAALTAVSTQAAERDVQLRTLTTSLSTIKKAADERVQ
ncbi:putative membrane protein [Bradyrhizobium sp. i1.4.4]|uniref:hypothetical protein n=1 Tax=Bradyrhizobium TaxID=374 RepID=UPI0024B09ECB|nr:hypothetical protein [Bradyrhizobium barranii]WFT96734.1 hypothetical protein QA633_06345 [Bradyrhizobium barranii]